MTEVRSGDVIFSYASGEIRAIGVATGVASETPKPIEFGSVGTNWASTGWLVYVSFSELETGFRPKSKISAIRSFLPEKYSPIRVDGNGNQKFYLTEISEELGELLLKSIGTEGGTTVVELKKLLEREEETKRAELYIRSDPALVNTEKEQLILARRGQGLFRSRVLSGEVCCRVTGLREIKHLRASHIKPWHAASNEERLDGHNGLLLSPHIDHLFDQGYISFTDDGQLIISSHLPQDVLEAWRLHGNMKVGTFSDRQKAHLSFHRQHVFQQ